MFNWNTLSSIVGHTVLTDGIHLNEKAADEIADLIVDWLLTVQVAKAIAVKR
jgi:lysophospholipase L1-like esterase